MTMFSLDEGIELYLRLMEEYKLLPNFITSREYLLSSNIINAIDSVTDYEYLRLVDRGTKCNLIPPISMTKPTLFHGSKCLLDSEGFKWGVTGHYFWDYEYVYCPSDVIDLNGSHKSTFRKNVSRFASKNCNSFVSISGKKASNFFIYWLQRVKNEMEIFEPEVINHYLLSSVNNMGLFILDRLVGVVSWDENYKFINFRYCFSLRDVPYTDEFLRYSFYEFINSYRKGKLVNDGGSLGSEGLERLKRKLCPCLVYKRYSCHKQGEEL